MRVRRRGTAEMAFVLVVAMFTRPYALVEIHTTVQWRGESPHANLSQRMGHSPTPQSLLMGITALTPSADGFAQRMPP